MKILKISLQNFKGCKSSEYNFGSSTVVSGANGSGKTTIFDAFTWVLFGKDSLDSAKFEVRPLDKDGKQIHEIEISVELELEIDGKTVVLKKTQLENWVKKRGAEVATLQGNVNKFEIDGYPKSEKDFKEYVNSLVDENLFKMLTNPMFFPNMPWKEQRAVIMRLAEKVSDLELAKKLKKFEPLLDEIEKAPSLDDIKAKYTKSINELKKKQAEIPVRIDEIANSKTDTDVAELELDVRRLKKELLELDIMIDGFNKKIKSYEEDVEQLLNLKLAQNALVTKLNADNIASRMEIERKIDRKEFVISQTENNIKIADRDLELKVSRIAEVEQEIKDLADVYNKVENLVFDENSLICSMCGQEYPSEKKASLKAEYERKKALQLADVIAKRAKLLSVKADIEAEVEKVSNERTERQDRLNGFNASLKQLRKELAAIPTSVDISDNAEYQNICNEIAAKEEQQKALFLLKNTLEETYSKRSQTNTELVERERLIAQAQRNIEVDERIEELRTELKAVSVKMASQEKIVYLLEEFIKYKLDKISKDINSMFDGVNFILFRNQINGGLAETCECNVNGVPYGSLNNGHRIVAGLQIIKALQKVHNAYLPIFVDNAEAINDFNVPTMNCQIIKLKVTDNKTLTVESEG